MINKYIVLLILVYSSSVNAQFWGDSLKAARNAFESEDFELAYDKFLSAQRLAPDEIDLSKDIATSAYRAEDYKTAEQIFQDAAKRDANEAHKKWLNVGNSQLKQENLKAAIESYKNALRQNPNDDKARYNLAQAKRILKEQKSQQEQQEQDNEQNSEEQDQDKKENEQQDGSENDPQSEEQQSEDQQQDQKDSGKENQTNASNSDQREHKAAQQAQQANMTEKRVERMLDELLKKEMETKQRVERKANKKGEGTSKSGKSW